MLSAVTNLLRSASLAGSLTIKSSTSPWHAVLSQGAEQHTSGDEVGTYPFAADYGLLRHSQCIPQSSPRRLDEVKSATDDSAYVKVERSRAYLAVAVLELHRLITLAG